MPANRFVYATLIDLGFDPKDPLVLLELGTEAPVDWDGVDGAGEVVCKRLDFVLTVEHVRIAGEPLGVRCTYDRLVKDHGVHHGLHVYVLGLRPFIDMKGRDSYQAALEKAVRETAVPGRSWCADIGQIRISWRQAPGSVTCLDNGAYEPTVPLNLIADRSRDAVDIGRLRTA